MAGGYAAGSAADGYRWLINTVYAPSTVTKAETFVWHSVTPDLRLGIAHLLEQNAFRFLGSYRLLPETATRPGLFASVGVQGIGTGNPGYSATAEKNWPTPAGTFNAFAGIGLRSNENHGHLVGGAKFTFTNGVTLGFQHEGHQTHPFVTYGKDHLIFGLYLIGGKAPATMVGIRF